MKKNKVLLIGWDAAEWKVIDDLIAKGLMPTMKKFLEQGVRGRLATLDPPLSPMLWTSIATGKRPQKHGILGFVEPDPKTEGIRPVSSKSRKVKALWNIFSQSDIKSNIIGWWPSNPVEPIKGAMVSNFYQQERKNRKTVDIDKWDMPEGTVHPEKWIGPLKELRVHPLEITGNLIMPFIPRAAELKKKDDEAFTTIVRYLAHATSIHAASTELMLNEDWDFTAVYHDAIDHFSHAFMKYHPPKLEYIDQERYDMLKDAITGAYRFHDMMLERLLNIVDDNTTVIICSDHGFHSDHLRPRMLPDVPSGPAVEHSPYGIFAIKGPGIKKNDSIYGSNILDITPTVLSLFDLPIGKDMDGKVLVNIYEESVNKKVKYIDSWENVDGDSCELSDDVKDDPIAEMAALEQLIDLGYIERPESNSVDYRDKIVRENKYYLAKSYACAGAYTQALEVLEEIIIPESPDYRWVVESVNACIKIKDYKKGQKYLNLIKDKNLVSTSYLNLLDSKIELALNNPNKAIELLNKALEDFSDSAEINIELAKVFLSLRRLSKAEGVFNYVLKIDDTNAYAHHGLGLVYLRQNKLEKAIECFLESIELIYHYPYAHFHLGEALVLLGEYKSAEKAFEQVALMRPNIKKTFRWLYDIQDVLGDKQKKEFYKNILDKIIEGNFTVITGLPSKKLEELLFQLFQEEVISEDYSDKIIGDYNFDFKGDSLSKNSIMFLPLSFLGSLPVVYDYKIIYIDETVEKSSQYINSKTNKLKEGYDIQANNMLQKQQDDANLWINQQPDLDLYYFSSNEKINSIKKLII